MILRVVYIIVIILSITININDLDSKNKKTDKKSYDNILIYYIGYEASSIEKPLNIIHKWIYYGIKLNILLI